ncbi:hypothetical protein AVEN_72435-1 [Araneus ventricosus]|uniref:Uncharacterized protein n=1 Tax=Araneus ventricosus TaxID=182803 RepID=A0A4Y2R2Z4_ARAVE|nr:hypothetical protein AVEN_72435-1 [Araneus ventricosus]
MLADSLLPVPPRITEGDRTFPQDNSSLQISCCKILDKSERSKNSPIAISESRTESTGKLLGILARYVYKNGRLYRSNSDLKAEIKYCWNSVNPDTFQALSGSMNRRLMQERRSIKG